MMGPAERVRNLVEPLITEAGLELWDVDFGGGVLRILIDRPGGADLDSISRLSEPISAILDETDAGPEGRYVLEVSSPGVERVLRTPDQYRRYIGELVAVKTAEPVDGERRFRGVLLAADDSGIDLRAEAGKTDPAEHRFSYDQIQQTRTVLVWGPAPKQGRARPNGRSTKATASVKTSAPMKDSAS
jgi:ribosome maturation factor RimP